MQRFPNGAQSKNLPIRSLVDELRVARIAGSPQFEQTGQNRS
jgi:hypothetical protein